MSATKRFNTRVSPTGRKARGDMVENNAGGYVFSVSDQERLLRILILGTDNPTIYLNADAKVEENADFLMDMAQKDGTTFVDTIVEVSTSGRAPKNDTALFALALASASPNEKTRAYALANLNAVARTFTHLALFVTYVTNHRGWGRGLRRAVANWYTIRKPDGLAYQMTKYRNREGWTHRDMLRVAHPKAGDEETAALFRWVTKGKVSDDLPATLLGFLEVQQHPEKAVELIHAGRVTSWEQLPTECHNDPTVWKTLLTYGKLPLGAAMRNMRRFSKLGLDGDAEFVELMEARFTSEEEIKRARLHPMNILVAQMNLDRDSRWEDMLTKAYRLAFGNIEKINGLRVMHGIDVSGSMGMYVGSSGSNLTAMLAAAAMAQTVAQMGDVNHLYSFATELKDVSHVDLGLPPSKYARDVLNASGFFGGTNAGLLIEKAIKDKLEVDVFILYTDSENWGGSHVWQLLEKYRRETGINAKMIGIQFDANWSSMIDPDDPLSINVVGFDTALPNIVEQFIKL